MSRVTVLCHLWNNNVLFNTENPVHPGDKMGPNPHLMSISMIPSPLARLQCVQWSNTNLLLLRGFGPLSHSSKKLSCLPSPLTEAVCSLNLAWKKKAFSNMFFLSVSNNFAHSSYEFNGICLIFIKPWKTKKMFTGLRQWPILLKK